ncbi:MAG: damage-inducible protein CinA [Bacteroidetes bacterium]|nr:MAG: damage-inducible protein CinA [Bacteroidota bacterium]PIE88010.1 MAG: damage-inducible protein CinA [Bacteroidota bacterium]
MTRKGEPMKCEIIAIGDELLIGQVVNTNAAWMGAELTEIGCEVVRVLAVADRVEAIKNALRDAVQRVDVVLMTGGLGPTNDDITKGVLCDFFHTTLKWHQPTYDDIQALWGNRRSSKAGACGESRDVRQEQAASFANLNRAQAMLPECCTPLPNRLGTAPGMWFQEGGTIVVSMPGVPFEMKAIMRESVLPKLKVSTGDQVLFHHTVITHGLPESFLAERIKDWELALPPSLKLAYLPRPGMVRLRLSAAGTHRAALEAQVMAQVHKLEALIPELIIGFNQDTMETLVKRLLVQQGKSVAFAESCTGGYLTHLMTSLPGASQCVYGSVVAYSDHLKEKLLGVSSQDLAAHGAVSEPVVSRMAQGVREITGSDYGVATSGIAGPDGGTDEKPVGTVWIAIADAHKTYVFPNLFSGNREKVMIQSSVKALNELRKLLLKKK